jgi:tetratricopeptide (TPR) repeat protein
MLMITFVLAFGLAQAAVASAQQTAVQAAEEARKAAAEKAMQTSLDVISKQIDARAIEEVARKAQIQARDMAAFSMLGTTALVDEQMAEARAAVASAQQAVAQAAEASSKAAADQTKQATRSLVYRLDVGSTDYERGVSALDAGRWQAAADAFDRVIKSDGPKADGAAFWKAYAQNRLGQRSESLATLDGLLKKSPNSRWAGDAKALQVEVRQLVGQPVKPEQETDEELKLLAIRGLLNTDSERALPMLESLLQGNASPRLKDQALFVLGMSESPKAREILVAVAKGKGNPDLQLAAIKYLSYRNREQNNALLVDIYKSTTDVDVKRRVIEALSGAVIGSRVFTVDNYYSGLGSYNAAVARSKEETSKPGAAAVDAQNDLWSLYQIEPEIHLKMQMVQALALAQSEKVLELARTEKNTELRQAAIQGLGMMKSPKTGDLLLSLYRDEKDPALKKAIVRGLYLQRNAPALVQIARQETDSDVKKDIVEKLSTMKAKEATDYMIELLKK